MAPPEPTIATAPHMASPGLDGQMLHGSSTVEVPRRRSGGVTAAGDCDHAEEAIAFVVDPRGEERGVGGGIVRAVAEPDPPEPFGVAALEPVIPD
jgi:hypothetical protein